MDWFGAKRQLLGVALLACLLSVEDLLDAGDEPRGPFGRSGAQG